MHQGNAGHMSASKVFFKVQLQFLLDKKRYFTLKEEVHVCITT